MERLKIRYIGVDDLAPYEDNNKQHTSADIKLIEDSIARFGFSDPIGVWGDGNIVVEGNARLQAARRLGLEEVPTIRLDRITDDELRVYATLHNWTAKHSARLSRCRAERTGNYGSKRATTDRDRSDRV